MLENESFQHLLNHAEPQRHSLTQILAVELAAEVEDLDNQMLQKRGPEAGLFQRFGLGRGVRAVVLSIHGVCSG